MRTIYRVLDWPTQLSEWAWDIRGSKYEWGLTDCGQLPRAALYKMFGEDIFPALPDWTNAYQAYRRLRKMGSIEELLVGLGAIPCTRNLLQNGAIVVQDLGRRLPAIFVYVEPILITSHPETGVQWYEREEMEPGGVGFNLW
ncbi:hypothetical protein LCGC14_3144640, partial [marine sediment metagenome]